MEELKEIFISLLKSILIGIILGFFLTVSFISIYNIFYEEITFEKETLEPFGLFLLFISIICAVFIFRHLEHVDEPTNRQKSYLHYGKLDTNPLENVKGYVDYDNKNILDEGEFDTTTKITNDDLENFIDDRVFKTTHKIITEEPILENKKSKRFHNSPLVEEFVKRRANGICELCKTPAPFNDNEGYPYLETHHIKWVTKGGAETVENNVALCCNCHRKMHVLDSKEDIYFLKKKVKSNVL